MKKYTPWITPPTQLATLPPAPSMVPSAPVLRTRTLGDMDPIGKAAANLSTTQKVFLAVHGVILMAVSYHGYKRNQNSVPWGLSWGLGGLLCPSVTLAFALTQGFAKRKSKARE